jgi:hypothetical protein
VGGGPMRFNGLRTDAQDVGDTLVGMTFGNQLQNRFLARRENLGLVFSEEGLQQKSMNDRAEERATGTKACDGGPEDKIRLALQDEAQHAGAQRLFDDGFILMLGEEEHFGFRAAAAHLACCPSSDALRQVEASAKGGSGSVAVLA